MTFATPSFHPNAATAYFFYKVKLTLIMMQGYMLAATASAQVRYCSPGIPRRWELHMGLLISNTLVHDLNVACL